MSWPSKQIIKEYNLLPKENQVLGDIVSTLHALDVKHVINRVNNHFYHINYGRNWDKPSTWCGSMVTRHSDSCEYVDYINLHNAVLDIRKALNARNHRMAIDSVSGDLDAFNMQLAALRQESDIIKQVTKDLL